MGCKMVTSPYLSEKSSDFDEIRYTLANVQPDSVHVTKNSFLKIQDGAAAILKITFLPITHRPIVRFQRNFV